MNPMLTTAAARCYRYELALAINPSLGLNAGELGEYVLDALFDMDRAGILFHGLSRSIDQPGMITASLTAIGYSRAVEHGQYQNPDNEDVPQEASEEKAANTLSDELGGQSLAILEMLKELRLFQAKLLGMAELLSAGHPHPDHPQQTPTAMLKAASDLLRCHMEKIKPLI